VARTTRWRRLLIVWGPGSPLPGPLAATRLWRAKTRRRKDLSSAAHVGDRQAVGIGAGRPAQLRVTAIVGDTPDLFAPLRLCARKTTPPRPPPPLEEPIAATPGQVAQSRRAAERSPQAPSSATLQSLGVFAPLREQRRTPRSPPHPRHRRERRRAPQTSLRLCAFAREKQRRHDHPPLEEPIAATPEQVAQSRRAAERSPQARSSGTSRPSERDAQLRVRRASATPQTSLRLCASARDKQRRHDHPPLEEPIPAHRTGRAEPQAAEQELCRLAPLRDLQPRRAPAIDHPAPRSAPPHPHTPTFFASPSCTLSPPKPYSTVRLPAPGALKPRSLSTPKTREPPGVTAPRGSKDDDVEPSPSQSPGYVPGLSS
jgi:hypothetical protein